MRIVAMFFCGFILASGERVFADSSLFAGIQKDLQPDILFSEASLDYDATDNLLTISSALGVQIDLPGGPFLFSGPTIFNLTAGINENPEYDGEEVTTGTGTLSIAGALPGYAGAPLLTGTVTAFRSLPTFEVTPNYSQMEFLFKITGGDAASLFGGIDDIGIVVVSSIFDTSPFGDFGNNFNNDFFASDANIDTASTTMVPEPASFLLAIFGVAGVVGVDRLRRRKHPSKVA